MKLFVHRIRETESKGSPTRVVLATVPVAEITNEIALDWFVLRSEKIEGTDLKDCARILEDRKYPDFADLRNQLLGIANQLGLECPV